MKIQVARANAKGLSLTQDGVTTYDHGPAHPDQSPIKGGWIGTVSTVYAIYISAFHAFYYVRNRKHPGILSFVPAACCKILDARLSRYWIAHHQMLPGRGRTDGLPAIYPVATFAIQDWIEDTKFLRHYAQGHSHEVAVMEQAIRNMDAEFG